MKSFLKSQARIKVLKRLTVTLCLGGCRVPEECPQGVVDLYLSCLATNPKARPKAEEVMESIAGLLRRS